MIRFSNGWALQLLYLLPLLLLMVYFEYRWRLKSLSKWAEMSMWKHSFPNIATFRLLLKRILLFLSLSFLIVALAGPQVGTRIMEIKREGTDIAIIVDFSHSMLAEDVAPNRLERARHEIRRFLSKLRGDRVALVPFAGASFIQVPLTLDYGSVHSLLDVLDPDIMPHYGSNIGEAIKIARNAFVEESKAQRVMLIISDGEEHTPKAIEEAKQAAKEGIIIFTIGMATPAGAPVPIKDRRGNVVRFKQDRGGSIVVSKLDEQLLQEIASVTGGQYYRTTSSGDEFNQIIQRLGRLDAEQHEGKMFTDYEDRFQWPLGAALLLLIAEELIPPYRRRRDDEND